MSPMIETLLSHTVLRFAVVDDSAYARKDYSVPGLCAMVDSVRYGGGDWHLASIHIVGKMLDNCEAASELAKAALDDANGWIGELNNGDFRFVEGKSER